jgi:hypothetical protein
MKRGREWEAGLTLGENREKLTNSAMSMDMELDKQQHNHSP